MRVALLLFFSLMLLAFLLVLFLNKTAILLAIAGAVFASGYPFLKRITHLPQVGLGIAFSWGVPMAFAALTGTVSAAGWLVFFTAFLWPIIYDTQYAMVDRTDDVKINIKSTAILFGKADRLFVGLLQSIFLLLLCWIGNVFQLKLFYYLSLVGAGILFIYQQILIKNAVPANCFKAFLNNNWVGCIIFLGIVISYVNFSG
jgi:4-hydroxybenzoate polyprenyltransferase